MQEEYLSVYGNRFELHTKDGVQVYPEGFQNEKTRHRYEKINETLGQGYLEDLYDTVESTGLNLAETNRELLRRLVQGVTSEVGRAWWGSRSCN